MKSFFSNRFIFQHLERNTPKEVSQKPVDATADLESVKSRAERLLSDFRNVSRPERDKLQQALDSVKSPDAIAKEEAGEQLHILTKALEGTLRTQYGKLAERLLDVQQSYYISRDKAATRYKMLEQDYIQLENSIQQYNQLKDKNASQDELSVAEKQLRTIYSKACMDEGIYTTVEIPDAKRKLSVLSRHELAMWDIEETLGINLDNPYRSSKRPEDDVFKQRLPDYIPESYPKIRPTSVFGNLSDHVKEKTGLNFLSR